MYKALQQRLQQRNEAIALARKYAERLREDLPCSTAILYGSFARGDFNLGSDIDVLVISDNLPLHPLKRMSLLYQHVEGGIEPKGYTRQEFLKMRSRHHPMVEDIIKEGIVLTDDGTAGTLLTTDQR